MINGAWCCSAVLMQAECLDMPDSSILGARNATPWHHCPHIERTEDIRTRRRVMEEGGYVGKGMSKGRARGMVAIHRPDPVLGHYLRTKYLCTGHLSGSWEKALGPREGGLMMGRWLTSRLKCLCGEQGNAKHDGAPTYAILR